MTIRFIKTALSGLVAVGLGAAALVAAPAANAVVYNASITPSVWLPSEQSAAVLNFDSSYATSGNTGEMFSVEIGWGWVYQYRNPSQTPVQYPAVHTTGRYTCDTIGVIFESVGFATAPVTPTNVKCEVLASSNYPGNPGQQVRLINIGSGGYTYYAAPGVSVTFPAGTITAPSSGPASDTWRIIDSAGGLGVTVATTVPAVDANGNALPIVTIDIDPNGGTCNVSKVTGYQNTWAVAPGKPGVLENQPGYGGCYSQGGSAFVSSYNTSPDGMGLTIPLGGNLHLTGDNRLYAIYTTHREPGMPTNVVATAGLNKVNITWAAPSDTGSTTLTNYLVTANPSGRVCITRLTDANMLTCEMGLGGTNTPYTFTVQALNASGWGKRSEASNAVSPYDVRMTTVTRTKNPWYLLGGSTIKIDGAAPGYKPGTKVTPLIASSASGNFEPLGKPVAIDKDGKYSVKVVLPSKLNGASKWVTVRAPGGAQSTIGYARPVK